jgi:hypothetical protein
MKDAAKAAGLKTYFTGHPCKHGHIAERSAATGQCETCSALRRKRRANTQKPYWAAYYNKHKERIRKRGAAYYQKNRARILAKSAEWYLNNNGLERVKARCIERRRTDIQFKLKDAIRKRMGIAIRRNLKTGSAVADLGCSIADLKIWLERQFLPGMSWENWSLRGWHIDHKRPLSSFDLTDHTQFLEACHYTNLQPLWRADNMKKNKY